MDQNNVYMNGAMADPSARTISAPSSTNTIMIGAIQNFLRTRMNAQRSFMKSNIRMVSPYFSPVFFHLEPDNFLHHEIFWPKDR